MASNYSECLYCQRAVLTSDIARHQRYCLMSLKVCNNCLEYGIANSADVCKRCRQPRIKPMLTKDDVKASAEKERASKIQKCVLLTKEEETQLKLREDKAQDLMEKIKKLDEKQIEVEELEDKIFQRYYKLKISEEEIEIDKKQTDVKKTHRRCIACNKGQEATKARLPSHSISITKGGRNISLKLF